MRTIPLVLVTGFLGSGKTTTLRHFSRTLANRRVIFLINEFSSMDVDGSLLKDLGPDTISVPGGSIFCKCLVSDFIATLTRIATEFNTNENPVEGVIIEASGIANPMVMGDMLKETTLDEQFSLKTIISVVDPGSFHKLVKTLPTITAQIEAANIIMVNKSDIHEEKALQVTEMAVRKINPGARLIRTENGEIETDPFGGTTTHTDLHGDYAKCSDPNYGRVAIHFVTMVDLNRLTHALTLAETEIYRAKGFVPTKEGLIYLDLSAGKLDCRPVSSLIGEAHLEMGLAIITAGETAERTKEFAARADAGEFNA